MFDIMETVHTVPSILLVNHNTNNLMIIFSRSVSENFRALPQITKLINSGRVQGQTALSTLCCCYVSMVAIISSLLGVISK